MKKITVGLIALVGVLVALPVLAASLGETINEGLNYGTLVGWGTQELRTTIMMVINVIMGFLGVVAIIIILWGGFIWMTAGGSEDKVAQAKKLIIAGIIGLAIVIGAYAIAAFVVQSLVNVTV